jgi:hypothetical protein
VEIVPHDSSPAPEPVLLALRVPSASPAGLIGGLVRPVSPTPPAVPLLDLDVPDEQVAEFLAHIAHADSGFVARTGSGARAVAIVAATAAALCGADIRAALANPDLEFLRGLTAPAVQALREVLLAVESDRPEIVERGLAVLDQQG